MFNSCLFCFGFCVRLNININKNSIYWMILCVVGSYLDCNKIDELEKNVNSKNDYIEDDGIIVDLSIIICNENVIVEYNCLFCFSCYSGDIYIVVILLEFVNKYVMNIIEVCYKCIDWVMNLLFIVCIVGYLEIIKVLIIVEVNVNYKIDICILFICVCENGYVSVVELLIDIGVDVNVLCIVRILLIVVCW